MFPLIPKAPQSFQFQPGQLPTPGRTTAPTGTFVSNPSAAPDGFLGGLSGSLNLPNMPLPQSAFPQIPTNPAVAAQTNQLQVTAPSIAAPTLFDAFGNAVTNPSQESVMYDASGNKLYNDNGQLKRMTSFGGVDPDKADPLLLYRNMQASPDSMGMDAARQIFKNMTDDQIKTFMQGKGYVLSDVNGKMEFVKSNAQSSTGSPSSSGLDERGRPKWLSASQAGALKPGETVDTTYGVFRGGTPVSKDIGDTPAGTSQYAITVKQNLDKKREARGDYKWESTVKKDENGQWVRTYFKVLRKAATRSAERRRAARAAEEEQQQSTAAQAQAQATAAAEPTQQETVNLTSLVTLRVAYG